MLSYREFEEQVRELNKDYEQWQHLLPAIPHQARKRYTDALIAGWDMPRAFDIVLTSTEIDDNAFAKLLASRKPGNAND